MSKYSDIHIILDKDVDFHGTLKLTVPGSPVVVAEALRAGKFKLRYSVTVTSDIEL